MEFLFLQEPIYFLPLDMIYIPGGTLKTGGLIAQIPPFYISSNTITQGQWWAVAGINAIEHFMDPLEHLRNQKNWQNLPVNTSWLGATEFCGRLSVATELKYRLPSLTEWICCQQAGSVSGMGSSWEFVADSYKRNLGEYPSDGSPYIPKWGTADRVILCTEKRQMVGMDHKWESTTSNIIRRWTNPHRTSPDSGFRIVAEID